jgi:hypothetical protein
MARVRSPNYPSLSLPAAVEAVRKVYAKNHTHKADPVVVAKALGYGGLNGASLTTLSALKKYGLLDEVGKELKVSASALEILVDPKESLSRAKTIVAAASLPQLFADLQAEYGDSVPSDEILRAFMLKRGFAQSTVDAPIRAYRDTMAYAAEAKSVYDGAADEVEDVQEITDPIDERKDRDSTRPAAPPSMRRPAMSETPMRQDVFSIEEGSVTIEWPAALSDESLKDIEDWLTIVKRKISRSVQKARDGKEEDAT